MFQLKLNAPPIVFTPKSIIRMSWIAILECILGFFLKLSYLSSPFLHKDPSMALKGLINLSILHQILTSRPFLEAHWSPVSNGTNVYAYYFWKECKNWFPETSLNAKITGFYVNLKCIYMLFRYIGKCIETNKLCIKVKNNFGLIYTFFKKVCQ